MRSQRGEETAAASLPDRRVSACAGLGLIACLELATIQPLPAVSALSRGMGGQGKEAVSLEIL